MKSGESMNGEMTPPRSLVGLADRDPYGYYDELLGGEPIMWSDEIQAWIASSAEACRYILRNDAGREALFRIPELDELAEIPRSDPKLTVDPEERRKLHRWWLQMFSPSAVDALRGDRIQPIIDGTIDRFVDTGNADLWADLAARVPVRAIASLMGLPWQDEDFMNHCKHLLEISVGVFDRMFVSEEEMRQLRRERDEARAELRALLLPFIRDRKDGKGSDLISLIWREGPEQLDGYEWSEEDVQVQLRHMFTGGTDTTSQALSSAMYLLLSEPGLMNALAEEGEKAISVFVEEALRLHPPAHFRHRLANKETVVAGTTIHKDQSIVVLSAAANRDPDQYESPRGVGFNRPAPRNHLSFNYGPHACVGAALARAELSSTVAAVVTRLPDMHFDPEMPRPNLTGLCLRIFRPLHVRFTPGQRVAR